MTIDEMHKEIMRLNSILLELDRDWRRRHREECNYIRRKYLRTWFADEASARAEALRLGWDCFKENTDD